MDTPLQIFDTTLRDGEQAPGFGMRPADKLRLARQLEALGVDTIEAGFPVASAADFDGAAAVARECRGARVAALARAIVSDIECAARALEGAARPRIHVFLATSDIHLQHKLRMTRAQALEAVAAAVARARRLVDDVEFSAEDATRSQRAFLVQAMEAAAAAGATTLNVPDTVGYATPAEFGALIRHLRRKVRGAEQAIFSVHCHNDLGLAVANSLAAAAAGARQVECTINGIGERAGNAALEELVMALRVRADALPFSTKIDTRQLHPTSALLTEITGVGVQPNKAVVGANAFAHEAGIHQDGMLKSALTYEIMTPEAVGCPGGRLVLGRHSGRHALAARLADLGFEFPARQLDGLYRRFVRLAETHKEIDDGQLRRLADAGAEEWEAAS